MDEEALGQHAMNDRITHLIYALETAKHHARAQAELDRWSEPQGGDIRGTLSRLTDDCRRAENDVRILEQELYAAQHSHQAFAECCGD